MSATMQQVRVATVTKQKSEPQHRIDLKYERTASSKISMLFEEAYWLLTVCQPYSGS